MNLSRKINWLDSIIRSYCEYKVGRCHGYTFDIDNKRIIFIHGNMSDGPDSSIVKFKDITKWVNVHYNKTDSKKYNDESDNTRYHDEIARLIWSEFISLDNV